MFKEDHYYHNYYCHDTREANMNAHRPSNNTSNSMAHHRAHLKAQISIIKSRSKSKQRTGKQALLWAIFLYALIQLFAADLPSPSTLSFDDDDDNSLHLLKLQKEAPTIKKTVALKSSLNSEESPNDDGCNRSKQQLCSSAARAKASAGPLLACRESDEAPLIKSTLQRPLFSASLPSVIHSSLLQIYDKLTTIIYGARVQLRSLFGPGPSILMAEAASAQQQQQQQLEKGIVVLNSTNFNRELLQSRHPFPHIKLIEFYVAYCGFCSKFKATYNNLAKEIHSWRNVIRPSVIDVSTEHNLPLAQSWRVDTVPTLRVFPPPQPKLASQIDKQLSKMMTSDQVKSLNEVHDYLSSEYTAAKPMVSSLEPSAYLNNIAQFKTDLLGYINSYVRSPDVYIPETWPNLKPVSEETLSKLLANHPRQELFLMIQGSSADQSQAQQASMGLQVMLELSSSASWKAVRYVKASENKALVEDVISQLKKLSRQPADQITEQVDTLRSFLTEAPQLSSPERSGIVLIHTDDSHSLVKMEGSSFAFISAMTGQDLLNAEQQSSSEFDGSHRVKRDEINHSTLKSLPAISQVELIAKHISHTYTETKEDRKFTKAINEIYRDPSEEQQAQPSEEITSKISTDSAATPTITQMTPQQQLSSSQPLSPAYTQIPPRANYVDDGESDEAAGDSSKGKTILSKLHDLLFTREDGGESNADAEWTKSSGDYLDKIKAIRYILFNEIPRTSFADKSISEQQEKLNILLNLVSVIKSYFPMADSSSIQFMDGVHTYLLKQQSKLLSVNSQQQQQAGLVFDTRTFKQELKRLESEDKRLPEVKEFRHCAKGGYPCALWRLFHTLTAFEYKKLNQIRLIPSPQTSTGPQQEQPQSSPQEHQQQPAEVISGSSNVAPAPEPMSSSGEGSYVGDPINSTSVNSNSDVPSPGERLVSPPSTTTSLSLTIVGPSTSSSANGSNNQKRITEADLPTPVLLVMRDYVTNFFGCTECSKNFQHESADLSLERIRQEPAEFSILWLWETHNRVNKRLSVDKVTNPPDNPKMWFPSYEQCPKCYKKPPSFLKDGTIVKDEPAAIFYESIDWNRQEVLEFLASEYTKQPKDYSLSNLFGHHLPSDFSYILAGCLCLLLLALLIRCFSQYVERQRRHKATLLNGNGAHYTLELRSA